MRLDGAILLVSPRVLDRFFDDCREAGIARIWLDGTQHPRFAETTLRAKAKGISSVGTIKLPSSSVPRKKARITLRWIGDVFGVRRAPH
jgi:hypothetical protein